ncbi:MAG: hypothetical protein ACTSP1_18815 [Candidatus Freyarchaeota archaeon]
MPGKLTKIPIREYLQNGENPPVYRLRVYPNFSPIDINIRFLIEEGWNPSDRLRFFTEVNFEGWDQPLALLITKIFQPSLIIRRYDREEDSFIHIHISQEGEIEILSNDRSFAQRYLWGLFLECPPSFHSAEELEIHEEWVRDQETYAMFLGTLHGALGWASTY